jgi:hypothetical protein
MIMMAYMNRESPQLHEALELSLDNPHTECFRIAEAGLEAWIQTGRSDDEDLVDTSAGRIVWWTPHLVRVGSRTTGKARPSCLGFLPLLGLG